MEKLVNRKNPIPLYIQLKVAISDKIENGDWKKGEVLPTEHDLQKRFGLSRTTVRQALSELVFEGTLERIQGKGTFVSEKKLEPFRPALTGFTKDMESQGKQARSIIINEKRVIDPIAQKKLGLENHKEVYKLERIRLVDDVRIGYHNTYLNPGVLADIDLDKYDFSTDSLYYSLEKEGIEFNESDESVEATFPTKEQAEVLEIDPGVPILKIERLVKTNDGELMEFGTMLYRADKYKYSVKLK